MLNIQAGFDPSDHSTYGSVPLGPESGQFDCTDPNDVLRYLGSLPVASGEDKAAHPQPVPLTADNIEDLEYPEEDEGDGEYGDDQYSHPGYLAD